MRAHKVAGHEYLCEMKVGIVVPYSWSFWGAVVEHAELQAAALRKLGHDVRLVMGNDPPGSFTRVLHPRLGRHGEPPPEVIPIGRSVIVPANGSLPNIILSPRSIFRVRRVLETERFDLLHLHEPMTPTPCVAALALAKCPLVATFHASGELSWLKPAKPVWGFLLDRLDHRIAVSEQARETAARYFPGTYELIPNGVLIPDRAEAGSRDEHIVFVGRHEPRKGLQVLLRAWPEIRKRSRDEASGRRRRPACRSAPLRAATRPRRRSRRARLPLPGRADRRAAQREGARSSIARRRELRDGAYARVRVRDAGRRFGHLRLSRRHGTAGRPPRSAQRSSRAGRGGRHAARGRSGAREDLGRAARVLAQERYSWEGIAQRLSEIYEGIVESPKAFAA